MKHVTEKGSKGIDENTALDTSLLSSNGIELELLPCEPFEIPFIELSYISKIKPSERPVVTNSDAAYRLLYQSWDKGKIDMQEQFKVLLLNQANKVLGIYELSVGGITSTVADPRLILAAAIKSNACAIILAHNHPSGLLKTSRADEVLTRKIKQAGDLLDIDVLDHIIVTSDGYFSFADHGLM